MWQWRASAHRQRGGTPSAINQRRNSLGGINGALAKKHPRVCNGENNRRNLAKSTAISNNNGIISQQRINAVVAARYVAIA